MQGNIADIVRINEKIRADAVRLIGPDGEQVGIVSVPEALNYADRLNLDLVEVAPAYDHADITALAGATLALAPIACTTMGYTAKANCE